MDDKSKDNSVEVINKYRDNPHVSHVIINEENSGSTFKQWHKGFELAKGEIIWIAESDDYCELNFLETLMSCWEKYPNCSVIQSATVYIDSNSVRLQPEIQYSGDVEYTTHVQKQGWQKFVKNGALSGTVGKALRLEAIKIRLTGELADYLDVYYRVQAQNVGWMGWAKNGDPAGTADYGYRLEAIQIVLAYKNTPAPGSTANCYFDSKNAVG